MTKLAFAYFPSMLLAALAIEGLLDFIGCALFSYCGAFYG